MNRSVAVVWREAIRDDPELDSTAKLVAFVLSTYMSWQGVAWPAKLTLMRGAGLGNRAYKGTASVDRAIDRLEAAGWLEVERRRGRRRFTYRAAGFPSYTEGFTDEEYLHEWRDSDMDDDVEIPSTLLLNPSTSGREIPPRVEGEVVEANEEEVVRPGTTLARRAADYDPLDDCPFLDPDFVERYG